MLTRADIDDILKLIDGSDFQELRLEIGDLKLDLRRAGAAPIVAAPAPAAPPPVVAPPAVATGGVEVPAPLLGTFYHAPRPGADVFVNPGDAVTPDTVIGIIEVMKLMNSVPAGVAGTVVSYVAPNGELVEHGQPLIHIQPH